MSQESQEISAARRLFLVALWGLLLAAPAAGARQAAFDVAPPLLAQNAPSAPQTATRGGTALSDLLDQAVEARRAKAFDKARRLLENAERRVRPSDDLYWPIRDERYFQLPLARAQQAMNDGKLDVAKSELDKASGYLQDNPRRGELEQTLERYRRALWMLR